jgi:hypothetical protein
MDWVLKSRNLRFVFERLKDAANEDHVKEEQNAP